MLRKNKCKLLKLHDEPTVYKAFPDVSISFSMMPVYKLGALRGWEGKEKHSMC